MAARRRGCEAELSAAVPLATLVLSGWHVQGIVSFQGFPGGAKWISSMPEPCQTSKLGLQAQANNFSIRSEKRAARQALQSSEFHVSRAVFECEFERTWVQDSGGQGPTCSTARGKLVSELKCRSPCVSKVWGLIESHGVRASLSPSHRLTPKVCDQMSKFLELGLARARVATFMLVRLHRGPARRV